MKHPASAGFAAALLVSILSACGTSSSGDTESFENRASYAIGVDLGNNLRRTGVELDLDVIVQGAEDVLADRDPRLTDVEVREVLQELATRLQANQEQQFAEAVERNIVEGQTYLDENGQRDGVVTTASGLQYEVLTQGDGPRPAATNRVSVHYRGTLIDGTEFDSSYERGEPTTFGVNQVIDGWSEALQLMPVGSKYHLVIPSDIAYGERGRQPAIGPHSTLIFEVELLEIVEQ